MFVMLFLLAWFVDTGPPMVEDSFAISSEVSSTDFDVPVALDRISLMYEHPFTIEYAVYSPGSLAPPLPIAETVNNTAVNAFYIDDESTLGDFGENVIMPDYWHDWENNELFGFGGCDQNAFTMNCPTDNMMAAGSIGGYFNDYWTVSDPGKFQEVETILRLNYSTFDQFDYDGIHLNLPSVQLSFV